MFSWDVCVFREIDIRKRTEASEDISEVPAYNVVNCHLV